MTNPNDPASPVHGSFAGMDITQSPPGLTKRELFAAMAMQGMWANAHFAEALGAAQLASQMGKIFAQDAVAAADALIAELNRKEGK